MRASISPINRARFCSLRLGMYPQIIAMKMMLSIPRTISSTISVKRLSIPPNEENTSRYASILSTADIHNYAAKIIFHCRPLRLPLFYPKTISICYKKNHPASLQSGFLLFVLFQIKQSIYVVVKKWIVTQLHFLLSIFIGCFVQ